MTSFPPRRCVTGANLNLTRTSPPQPRTHFISISETADLSLQVLHTDWSRARDVIFPAI